jgi:uncharacterized tellurite resistance protein B-like protein
VAEAFVSLVIVAGCVLAALLIAKAAGTWRFGKRNGRHAAGHAAPERSDDAAGPATRAKAPVSRGAAQWHGPGTAMSVAGFTIADGMVYVGRLLPVDPTNPRAEPDPALIDPTLPIATASADLTGSTMTYWPSYSAIQPSARTAYLRWLSSGKADPHAYIGYVFLYFYGLERRLLIDRPPAKEAEQLIAEVERLRTIYGSNGSFARYSRGLIDAAIMLGLLGRRSDPDTSEPDLLAGDNKLSLPVKIRIGRMIKEGRPLPFDLTLAAYISASRLPMPAERCRAEFVALMHRRFSAKYPDGFKVRPRHGPLETWYRGASRYISFDLLAELGIGNLPDPDLQNWERLDEMVADACEALGPYARFVSRRPDKAGSLEAKNLLPAEIRADAVTSAGGDLRTWLEREASPVGTVPLAELATRVLGPSDGKLGAKTLRALADILEEFGYGVEPDPRFTAFRADGADVALVFKAPDPAELAREPRKAYRLASAIVTLVAGLANASTDGFGSHELAWVGWIDKRIGLTATEAARLRAHLYWLVAKKISLGQIKKMLVGVPADERESVVRFAAAVASADGIVDKTEVAFLERIADELGVGRATVYAALHETTASTTDADPGATTGFKIPKPPPAAKPAVVQRRAGKGALDRDRIAKVMAETDQVSTILAGVFVDEMSPSPPGAPAAAGPGLSQDFEGLDAPHGRLLSRLLAQTNWTRADFDAAARAEGLMPDGALETINEWSYGVADDALIEDDGDLKVNQALGRELAA